MTNMKQSKTGAVILVALLLACALVATVSAAEDKGVVRTVASEAQLKIINELYGKNITVLDYMEKVHPEHLVGVKDSIKKNMAKQTMNWWGKEPAPTKGVIDRALRTERATVQVTATGGKYDWRTILYSGTCTASISNPWYIYIEAFLINRDTGQTADSISESSQSGTSNTISTGDRDKLYPANGQYYVHAWGYIPNPYYAEDTDETTVFSFP